MLPNDGAILITGASGFLGRAIAAELVSTGYDVIGISRFQRDVSGVTMLTADLRNSELLDTLPWAELGPISCVIHCAALDGNANFKQNAGSELLETNLRMALSVFGLAKRLEIPTLVLLSSTEVYLGGRTDPLKEHSPLKGLADLKGNGYAVSKVIIEELAKYYRGQSGRSAIVVRPCNVYGPGDDFAKGRVIPTFIRKCIDKEPIEIWGDASQSRNFIFVGDLARAIRCVCEQPIYDTITIASPEDITLLQLAKLVAEKTGESIDVILREDLATTDQGACFDISRLSSLIDFDFMNLRDGIDRTIQEYDRVTRGWTSRIARQIMVEP